MPCDVRVLEGATPGPAAWYSQGTLSTNLLGGLAKAGGLFFVTAIAEIIGCYLPYLWLRKGASPWLLAPAGLALALFAWLLTLHPTGAGRTYAAYGGAYVATAVLWLWLAEGQRPDRWDLIGTAICVVGMAIIVLAPRN